MLIKHETRAFSAPGKALLAGGYLVLYPQYQSLVVALSARMHAVVTSATREDIEGIYIKVMSEQFNNDEWNYRVYSKHGFIPMEINDRDNPFLEQVIFNVCNYFFPKDICQLPKGNYIKIELFSDTQFHSEVDTTVRGNQYLSFNYHRKTITEVPKTGLGSSASLVTVLTTALCHIMMEDELNVLNFKHLKIIHNLSQVAHCQAQGKIGSGFDVAAAIYGSVIYKRFPPDIVANLPDMDLTCLDKYHNALKNLVDCVDWEILTKSIMLPPGLKLVMGDVNTGSETVKLVSKVRQWYDSNLPHSLEIFQTINKNNLQVIETLHELIELHENNAERYEKIIADLNKAKLLKKLDSDSDEIVEDTENDNQDERIKKICQAVKKIRTCFKTITQESGAPVEPELQTKLLNHCLQLTGVVTAVVPGAGGYDAIALLCTEQTNLTKLTENDPHFDNVKWLQLRQSSKGLKEENPEQYEDLLYK